MFEDYAFLKITVWNRLSRFPPRKDKKVNGDEESREGEDDASEGNDGGESTRKLRSFDCLMESKHSRGLLRRGRSTLRA